MLGALEKYRGEGASVTKVSRGKPGRRHTEEVEHVFKDEKDEYLREDLLPVREGHLPGGHAECLRHGVEQPNLSQNHTMSV